MLDEILTALDISSSFDLMVSIVDFLILDNEPLHLLLEKLLQKDIDSADIDPFFLLLQFLTHSLHHHLLDLLITFLSLL